MSRKNKGRIPPNGEGRPGKMPRIPQAAPAPGDAAPADPTYQPPQVVLGKKVVAHMTIVQLEDGQVMIPSTSPSRLAQTYLIEEARRMIDLNWIKQQFELTPRTETQGHSKIVRVGGDPAAMDRQFRRGQ